MERVYKSAKQESFNWYLLVAPVAGFCAITIVATMVTKRVQSKKNRKGGATHENL
jgi:hypothetical protein